MKPFLSQTTCNFEDEKYGSSKSGNFVYSRRPKRNVRFGKPNTFLFGYRTQFLFGFVPNIWNRNKTSLEPVLCLTNGTILFGFKTAPKSKLFGNRTKPVLSEIRTFRFRTFTVLTIKRFWLWNGNQTIQ